MYGKSNMETYITICKVDRQKEFVLWEVVMDREACCAAVHVYKVSETA